MHFNLLYNIYTFPNIKNMRKKCFTYISHVIFSVLILVIYICKKNTIMKHFIKIKCYITKKNHGQKIIGLYTIKY